MTKAYVLERPFHFIVVFWGEHFTSNFLNYCARSMLAPGNLPTLSTQQQSKFLIATRPDDWKRVEASPVFSELKKFIEPVFIELPPCPPATPAVLHMGIGHKQACAIAYNDRAYAAVITPDSILSDSAVRNLQAHAANGFELVWVSALRFGEEPFLGHLKALGCLPERYDADSSEPLIVPARDMAFAAINGMHTETLSYEWEASYFARRPSAVWWRVPGENGVLVHCLSWAPLLFDFSIVEKHDTTALESWTIDGDYVFKNMGRYPKAHIVQDSDEIFYGSWSPLADRPLRLEPRLESRFRVANLINRSHGFREDFYSPMFDPLKRRAFLCPVRWHANPINSSWRVTERRAARQILFSISRLTRRSLTSEESLYGKIAISLRIAIWMLPILLSFFLAWLLKPARIVSRCIAVLRSVWRQRQKIKTTWHALDLSSTKDRKMLLWYVRYVFAYAALGRVIRRPPDLGN